MCVIPEFVDNRIRGERNDMTWLVAQSDLIQQLREVMDERDFMLILPHCLSWGRNLNKEKYFCEVFKDEKKKHSIATITKSFPQFSPLINTIQFSEKSPKSGEDENKSFQVNSHLDSAESLTRILKTAMKKWCSRWNVFKWETQEQRRHEDFQKRKTRRTWVSVFSWGRRMRMSFWTRKVAREEEYKLKVVLFAKIILHWIEHREKKSCSVGGFLPRRWWCCTCFSSLSSKEKVYVEGVRVVTCSSHSSVSSVSLWTSHALKKLKDSSFNIQSFCTECHPISSGIDVAASSAALGYKIFSCC